MADAAWSDAALEHDALDRRAALAAAVAMTDGLLQRHNGGQAATSLADQMYAWLRARDSLKVKLSIAVSAIGSKQDEGA